MLATFVNLLNLQEIPALDIKDGRGHTDYIDFITVDMMQYPVMKGMDCLSRPFISFKVDCSTVKPDGGLKHSCGVYTVFQRYSNSDQVITTGTCYADNVLFPSRRAWREDFMMLMAERVNLLLKGWTLLTYAWDFDIIYEAFVVRGSQQNHRICFEDIRAPIRAGLSVWLYKDLVELVMRFV